MPAVRISSVLTFAHAGIVTHPIQWERDHRVGAAQGAAACESERDKRRRYAARLDGNPVLFVPLAFETYRRWGDAASSALRCLVRLRSTFADSRQSVDPHVVFRGCLIRWRRQVSVVLQQGECFHVVRLHRSGARRCARSSGVRFFRG